MPKKDFMIERKRNIIRIDNLDQEIYRIFPLYRIEEMLSSQRLILVKPNVWDDPFENFLLNCTAVEEDGTEVGLSVMAASWFGLCWTLNVDSDAMWRIYSQKKDGIRIKTTIRKLFNAAWEVNNTFSPLKYFIGKVSYHSREELEKFLKDTSFWSIASGGQNDGFAKTLLMKRTEFEHENEVKILVNIAVTDNDQRIEGSLYKISINTNNFIDEICIDPRLSNDEANVLKEKIKALGYAGTINQSELYKLRITRIKMV